MAKVKVYGRLKPISSKKGSLACDIQDEKEDQTLFLTLKNEDRFLNNKPETYAFKFRKVFDQNAKQLEIFDAVAKPVVESVLQGYNGTVFAYGQTGSGKTFSITGGPDSYEDRGIIPRTIQYVFKNIQMSQNIIYTTFISFLEIYNENGFDLLGPKHDVSKLDDLPRVSLLEDNNGKLHVRNMTLHPVSSEEEALNLLFLGDTNRTIAETPMNPFSSRSHCIFTLHLSLQDVKSATVRRAKLHLVDLAGSERVHKTGVGGRILNEARHINLSLHFLEQVISALGETGRAHVPYRNSLLTCMLRDSLGGNCLTAMLATLSLDETNMQETISTCRFAQRVALITNNATVNEERDPLKEVVLLKSQIRELKEQLALLSANQVTEELSEEERDLCRKWVENFLKDGFQAGELSPDVRKIRLSFKLLREAVLHTQSKVAENSSVCDKELLRQRDNEIGILISLLRRERKKLAEISSSNKTSSSISCPESLTRQEAYLSNAEKEAFKIYTIEPRRTVEVDRLQAQLQQKYNEAKRIANDIHKGQQNIEALRRILEQNGVPPPELKKQLELEQCVYKNNLSILRNLKSESDHLKHGLEQAKYRMVNRFRDWWAASSSRHQSDNSSTDLSTSQSDSSSLSVTSAHPEEAAPIVPHNFPPSSIFTSPTSMNNFQTENLIDDSPGSKEQMIPITTSGKLKNHKSLKGRSYNTNEISKTQQEDLTSLMNEESENYPSNNFDSKYEARYERQTNIVQISMGEKISQKTEDIKCVNDYTELNNQFGLINEETDTTLKQSIPVFINDARNEHFNKIILSLQPEKEFVNEPNGMLMKEGNYCSDTGVLSKLGNNITFNMTDEILPNKNKVEMNGIHLGSEHLYANREEPSIKISTTSLRDSCKEVYGSSGEKCNEFCCEHQSNEESIEPSKEFVGNASTSKRDGPKNDKYIPGVHISTDVNRSKDEENEELTEDFLENIPLTGDKEIDEEIIEFYTVKHKVLNRKHIKVQNKTSSTFGRRHHI